MSASSGVGVRRIACGFALLGLCWTAASGQTKAPVRIALNPSLTANLPFYVAADKGYFAAQNIDLNVKPITTSTTAMMPLVARGDLDITPQADGPALFNASSEGFDVKIIASIQATHVGWAPIIWIMVRKDLWDSGTIRTLKDLRGHKIDGGPDGGAAGYLVNQGLVKAGLSRADVQYSTRLTTNADWLTGLMNKVVDVTPGVEPSATVMVTRGVAEKLASPLDVYPDDQGSFIVASSKYIREHRSTVVAFLKAYLQGAMDVTASGGKWTPELIATTAKWTEIPASDVEKFTGPPYFGQYGMINRASIERAQNYFAGLGLVKAKVDMNSIIEDGPLLEARKELHIK